MSLLIFLITLSVLVFVHELGHFLMAKKNGVKVDEFGFGLPPRIWGRKFGETLYSINLLPVGGFVKLKGEEAEVLGFAQAGSFAATSAWRRAGIIVAGVFGNLLLAYLLLTILFMVGNPTFVGQVRIEEVVEGSPAAQAGLMIGDQVIAVAGRKVATANDLVDLISQRRGQVAMLELKRGGQSVELTVWPRLKPPEGEGPLGVRLGFASQLTYRQVPFWQAPYEALLEVKSYLGQMAHGLGQIASGLLAGRVPADVAGPLGIYKISSQALSIGLRIYLQFVALISLNLFLFNLLPLPALDGGRLVFVIYEMIFRKAANPKIERTINNLGLLLLLTLFVLVTLRDFRRF